MKALIIGILLIGSVHAETLDLFLGPAGDDYLLSETASDERFTGTFFGYLPGDQAFWLAGDVEALEPSPDSLTYWEANFLTLDTLPSRTIDDTVPMYVDLTFIQLYYGGAAPAIALMDVTVTWNLLFDGVVVATGEGQEIQGQVDENDLHLRWNVTVDGEIPEAIGLQLIIDGPSTYVAIAGNGESFLSFTLAGIPEGTSSTSTSTVSSSSTSTVSSSSTSSSSTSSTQSSTSSSASTSSSSSSPSPTSSSSTSSSTTGEPESEESPFPILAAVLALAIIVVRRRIS